jgi:sialidase-1
MVRSRDGGKTWGERQVLRRHAHTDERSGSLCQLRDGTILANHWPNRFYDLDGYYVYKQVHDQGQRPGMYVGRSTDNGYTWTWPPDPIDPSPFPAIYTAEHIVELPSGRLILPVYFWIQDGDHWGSAVFCSDDKGVSWRYLATVADVPGLKLDEPALVVTNSGRLVCIMRNDTGNVYYQSNSDDGGETWTPAQPTPIPGHYNPACLAVLPDGALLCIFSSRADPSGIFVVASYDNGETWDMAHRRVLRDDFPNNNDSTYPSAVVMPDGRVFAAYYFNMFGRFFIAGSFFRWER